MKWSAQEQRNVDQLEQKLRESEMPLAEWQAREAQFKSHAARLSTPEGQADIAKVRALSEFAEKGTFVFHFVSIPAADPVVSQSSAAPSPTSHSPGSRPTPTPPPSSLVPPDLNN